MNNHTNKRWHPYKKLGSYYRLINGVLMFRPMLANGRMEGENHPEPDYFAGGEVDFELLEGDKLPSGKLITNQLREIKLELSAKL